jgi:hypothetical protein
MNSTIYKFRNLLSGKNFKILRKGGILVGLILLSRQIYFSISIFKNWQPSNDFIINFLISFFFIIIAIFFQMLSWKYMMSSLNINLRMYSILKGYTISFLPKYIPGGFWGYLERSNWLKQDENIGYRISYFSSLFEIFLVFYSSAIIVSIYLGFQNSLFYFFLPILIIGGFFFFRFVIKKIYITFINNKENFNFLNWRYLILCNFFSLLMWFSYGIALNYLINIFSNSPIFNISYFVFSTFSFCISWIIGFVIIIIPSGIGVRENAISFFISYHFPLALAQANFIAILFRLIIIFGEVFYILLGLIFFNSKDLFIGDKDQKKQMT